MDKEISHLREELNRILDRSGISRKEHADLETRICALEKEVSMIRYILDVHFRRDREYAFLWERSEGIGNGMRHCEGEHDWRFLLSIPLCYPQELKLPGEESLKVVFLCDPCREKLGIEKYHAEP